MSLAGILIHFAHPLLIQLFFYYLIAIIDDIASWGFIGNFLQVIVFRIEEGTTGKGWIDILFIFTPIFKRTMENGADISGIKHFVVGV